MSYSSCSIRTFVSKLDNIQFKRTIQNNDNKKQFKNKTKQCISIFGTLCTGPPGSLLLSLERMTLPCGLRPSPGLHLLSSLCSHRNWCSLSAELCTTYVAGLALGCRMGPALCQCSTHAVHHHSTNTPSTVFSREGYWEGLCSLAEQPYTDDGILLHPCSESDLR